jgi:hypothetical protein
MTLVAVPLNWIAFPWKEFNTQIIHPSIEMMEGGNVSDTEETNPVPIGSRKRDKLKHVMGNAIKIFSPDDMVENAEQNMRSKYKTHVLLESAQEYVIEDNPVGEPIVGSSSPEIGGGVSKKKRRKTKVAKFFGKPATGSASDDASLSSAAPEVVFDVALHEDISPIAHVQSVSESALEESPPVSPSKPLFGPPKTSNVPLPPIPPPRQSARSMDEQKFSDSPNN